MKTSYYFEKVLEKGREVGGDEEKIKKLEEYGRNCFTMGNSHGYIRGVFLSGATLLSSAAILKVLEAMAYRKAGIK